MKIEMKHGTTRKVLLIGKYAFKFPNWDEYRLFLHGLLANQQEALWWREMRDPPEVRTMMCPVLFYAWGGWLVVMPRCKPLSRKEFLRLAKYRANNNLFTGFETEFNRVGIPVECKACSFGRLDGRIVAVDYGS
jgi:hypothetical protein